MYGIIYKIYNSVNDKVYIGKTIRPIKDRFNRHIKDAMKTPNTEIHLQRAIRDYGPDKFYVIQIDTAESEQELNDKEKFWIKQLNSIQDGYNVAEGGEGGNTYKGLSKEQLDAVKQKIGNKNSGRNNGMSKQVKCKSIITNEEHYFESVNECLKFFGVKNKSFINAKATGKDNTLYLDEWLIAYENDEYANYEPTKHYDLSCRKGYKTILSKDSETITFNSINQAAKFFNSNRADWKNIAQAQGYEIQIYPRKCID